MKQVGGLLEIELLSEAQLATALEHLSQRKELTGHYTSSLDSVPARRTYTRWVVTDYAKMAITELDGSYKLGLARALAEQIGVTADQLVVESFYDNLAAVATRTEAANRAVADNSKRRSESTGILFKWIKFGNLNPCPNCAGIDCEAVCRNRERCSTCAGPHITSKCDRNTANSSGRKVRKRPISCIRCRGIGKPHTGRDWWCPVLRRVIANPNLLIGHTDHKKS